MKCCPSAVNIFLLKGHTISYLVRNVWYLVRNMWLPSRCTSHSPSAPYVTLCSCLLTENFDFLFAFFYNLSIKPRQQHFIIYQQARILRPWNSFTHIGTKQLWNGLLATFARVLFTEPAPRPVQSLSCDVCVFVPLPTNFLAVCTGDLGSKSIFLKLKN